MEQELNYFTKLEKKKVGLMIFCEIFILSWENREKKKKIMERGTFKEAGEGNGICRISVLDVDAGTTA